ncbi:putative secreted protein (Por secretion system target) [Taibaiella chishuiensis]|uniref:Putative secreted protein (Por secretion system target) n=2 Tax=Taibaiella chishuiensis TaxID=1434707 RepID=A0A2P8D8J4_9BACT|nr:putative secreted protein (Por secretion system target) [Taibaiella chishuiensis]
MLFACCCSSLPAQNLQWIKSFGPNTTIQANAQKITRDPAGNIYIGGSFRGTVDFDPGPGVFEVTANPFSSAYLLKVDANGNFLWVRSWADIEVSGLEIDAADHLYVTGANGLAKKYAADGTLIWSKTIPGNAETRAIKILDNNLYFVGGLAGTLTYTTANGTQTAISNGQRDIFIMKADTSGQIKWLKQIGGVDDDRAFCLTTTSDGKIVVGGTYRNTVDFDPGPGVYNLTSLNVDEAFVVQLDTNGNFQWADGFIGAGNSIVNGLATDNGNNIYGVGYYTINLDLDPTAGQNLVTSNGSDDIFYFKLNPSGNVLWGKSIGGSSNDWGYQVNLTPGGGLIISGRYSSANVNFDPGNSNFTHSCNGAGNVYFISADADGQFLNAGFIEGTSLIDITQLRILPGGGFLVTGSYNYCGNGCDFDPGSGTQDLPALDGLARHAYFAQYSDIMPLPLHLLRINAARTEQGNLVSWTTTDEVGVRHYEIERSFNSIDFEQAGIVAAYNRTGIHQYGFTDIDGVNYGASVYYRIKMVDRDNSYKYSKIVSLTGSKPGDGIILSPNPVTDILVVGGAAENDKLLVRDICGHVVMSGVLHKPAGNRLDVRQLLPGIYILSVVRADGAVIHTKFTRQ